MHSQPLRPRSIIRDDLWGRHAAACSTRGLCRGSRAPWLRRWSPEQLHSVVADVENYKHFVPWCQKSVVTKRNDDGSMIEAELEVGFQMLVERCGRPCLRIPACCDSTLASTPTRYKSIVTIEPHRRVHSTVEDSSE
jgi:ribosome-associated toxin RatA of RatAB toxin-antitoxin module